VLRLAKGPMGEEFCYVVQQTMQDAKAKLEQPHKVTALYSWDNAPIHAAAAKVLEDGTSLLSRIGFSSEQQAPLPPYAPDLHRAIEHAHGRAVALFNKQLYRDPVQRNMLEYKVMFEKAFRAANSPAVIRWDVAGLPELYTWVAQNGGCWAPKSMR
jgi:hypothetical protein